MKFKNKIGLAAMIFFSVIALSIAQIGIGTSAPEGILDLSNSNSTGFIYPRVALTSTIVQAPVLNPAGGSIVEGTVVYNTNTTATGNDDVTPGNYAWDGSMWIPQYLREDAAQFEQTVPDLRTTTGDTSYNTGTSDWVEIPGLGTGSSFTPKYTGIYKIKTSFNFGAGRVILPTTGQIMMATQEGLIRFTFNGTPYLTYTHSYSAYNGGIGLGTYYENFKHDSSLTQYVNLTAGTPYNFKLEVDIFVSTDFENGGNSGNGMGHVGADVPCTVEFSFQGI
jgi:hypothetical protein